VVQERQRVPYKVVESPAGDARVQIPQTGQTYTPQEISAMILQSSEDAEAYLGEP
jgi:molecular chaperone DnaK (HSP70)